jgi:hypothetical protein
VVLQGHKDLWVLKEKLEIQVWEDLQDHQDQEVFLGLEEKMGKVGKMESPVQVAQLVHLVKEGYLECQVCQDQKATVGSLVLMVLKAT